MTAIPLEDDAFYPESDGEPVAETEIHFEELVYVWQALKDRFADEPEVFVGANLFLYYRQGNPRAVVAPDGFVVRGVPKRLPGDQRRRKYLLWEEGQAPCFVLETTSRSTHGEDWKTKRGVYEKLGVEEYFLFDPLGEYLSPRLQGFHLAERGYRPLRERADGSLFSQTTGILFQLEGSRIRLVDAFTGAPLLRQEEEAAVRHEVEGALRRTAEALQQSEEKAAVAAQARHEAEQALRESAERMKALEAELAHLRGPRLI